MNDTTTPTDLTAGFRCPLCGAAADDGTTFSLSLTLCQHFRCDECSEDFGISDIEAQITAGKRLIAMAHAAKAAGLSALGT